MSTPASAPTRSAAWTFLSTHGQVLVCLAKDPGARLRDLAAAVGITERAVHTIVTDLESRGAITRIREGRRNRYVVHSETALRHPVESRYTVQDLVDVVGVDNLP